MDEKIERERLKKVMHEADRYIIRRTYNSDMSHSFMANEMKRFLLLFVPNCRRSIIKVDDYRFSISGMGYKDGISVDVDENFLIGRLDLREMYESENTNSYHNWARKKRYDPELPNWFSIHPVGWYILRNSQYDWHKNDEEDVKEILVATHIAKLLIGLYASQKHDEKIVKEALRQLKEFVGTGTIALNRPDKIDLKDKKSWPGGLLSVGDNDDGLVYKHGKYCARCGGKIKECFCTPIKEQINLIFEEYTCSDCWKSEVNELLTNGEAKERDSRLKELLLDFEITIVESGELVEHAGLGKFFDWEYETDENGEKYDFDCSGYGVLKEEQLKEFWKLYWEEMNDYYDYEPPEGSCACPGW
jgi:hypothetical protein